VHTLKARISQIKKIRKGETVGYERNFTANKEMKIATVNLGYADGIFRIAGNGKYHVIVNNKPALIIGNICMDMFIIDVSTIQEISVKDEVIIFGKNHPIEALAKTCQTIPYEILTRISNRIKRLYVHSKP
jgi:alanine racemase